MNPHALHSVCYFFLKDDEVQQSLATALWAAPPTVCLTAPAYSTWEKDSEKIQQEVDGLWQNPGQCS